MTLHGPISNLQMKNMDIYMYFNLETERSVIMCYNVRSKLHSPRAVQVTLGYVKRITAFDVLKLCRFECFENLAKS